KLNAALARGVLKRFQVPVRGDAGVRERRHLAQARHRLDQDFLPLAVEIRRGGRNHGTERIDAAELLRGGGQRPSQRRHRPAEQRDGCAPSHSITSSASNWIELGTSMPSALAVCRLMTNSNLVDRTTGSSAGFAPLRIRPVETPG